MFVPIFFVLVLVGVQVPSISQAGVIGNAPRFTTILTNTLQFLLSVVGVLAIIGIVIAGGMYFFTSGDVQRADTAKKILFGCIAGLVIALGGLVLVRTIASFGS